MEGSPPSARPAYEDRVFGYLLPEKKGIGRVFQSSHCRTRNQKHILWEKIMGRGEEAAETRVLLAARGLLRFTLRLGLLSIKFFYSFSSNVHTWPQSINYLFCEYRKKTKVLTYRQVLATHSN